MIARTKMIMMERGAGGFRARRGDGGQQCAPFIGAADWPGALRR